MMGRTHALTGVALAVGTTLLVPVPVPAGIAGTFICAGAALLPDIDHGSSTVSNTYGPVTRGFSWVLRKSTGGHRRFTHSVFGIALMGMIAQYGVVHRDEIRGQIPLCTIMILCAAGTIRLFKIPGWIDDMLPIPVVIGLVCLTSVPLDIVPPAIMLGCAVHVLGDVATKMGCPLWWPLNTKRVKFALFKTNGTCERRVVTPLTCLAIVAGVFAHLLDTPLG